jgi:hypothetical protein
MDAYARERREQNQARLLDYLRDHPCVDCGERDPVVLDLDHVRDKVANVSAMVYARRPWSVIAAEIAKCEVRCAKCHRRRTAERLGTFRLRHGEAGNSAPDGL